MCLLDEIKNAKQRSEELAKFAIGDKDIVKKYFLQSEMQEIVKRDLMNNNPDKLFQEYKEYFETKNLPIKIIRPDECFYRGRIGNEMIYGADDDCDVDFILPYYQKQIESPPPVYTAGGRFNRQGISYLYLADTIETCLAEVHLQIGQNCSVGKFKCKQEIEVIDLTKFNGDLEMEIWLEIMTQPVHIGTQHIYNTTCFLADVFKSINRFGIYFESVQAAGHNIVCFDPSLFELIKYSEKIYTATKINYLYQEVEDSIRKYAKRQGELSINSYNENVERRNDEKFEYLSKWIECERENLKKEEMMKTF